MADNDLIGEVDAQVWAKHWLETIAENPSIPTDENAMTTWFANAIWAGYNQARIQSETDRKKIEEFVKEWDLADDSTG